MVFSTSNSGSDYPANKTLNSTHISLAESYKYFWFDSRLSISQHLTQKWKIKLDYL